MFKLTMLTKVNQTKQNIQIHHPPAKVKMCTDLTFTTRAKDATRIDNILYYEQKNNVKYNFIESSLIYFRPSWMLPEI